MTPIPARILRQSAESCRFYPQPTQKDRDRTEYLLEAGEKMLILHGPRSLTIAQFGYATHLAPVTIRRQVCDLDHLFSKILQNYLHVILKAVMAIHMDSENLLPRRRAAYFQATRGICDIPTPIHFLLLRDRFLLPQDELEEVEKARRCVGNLLGGEDAEDTLHLLDHPTFNLAKIEALCRAAETHDQAQNLARAQAQAQVQAKAQAKGQARAPARTPGHARAAAQPHEKGHDQAHDQVHGQVHREAQPQALTEAQAHAHAKAGGRAPQKPLLHMAGTLNSPAYAAQSALAPLHQPTIPSIFTQARPQAAAAAGHAVFNPLARPPYPAPKPMPRSVSDALADVPDEYLLNPDAAPIRQDAARRRHAAAQPAAQQPPAADPPEAPPATKKPSFA